MRLTVTTGMGLSVVALACAGGAVSANGGVRSVTAGEATPKPRIGVVYAGVGTTASTLVVGGTVDTAGQQTTYVVEYGPSAQYGRRTEPQPLPATSPAGTTTHDVRVTLDDVAPHTRYHYRLVISNALGSVASRNRTIVSGGEAPRISGAFVRPGATRNSVVLGATVDTRGLVTAVHVQCGRLRSTDVILPAMPGRGWAPTRGEARFVLRELAVGKQYPCRLLAFNEAGSTGYQRPFEAGAQPRGVQSPAVTSGATPAAVVLTATIDTGGSPTEYHIDYGADRRYGSSTPTRRLRPKPATGWTPTTTEIRANLRGLEPGKTYYYRIVATNADGRRTVSRSFVSEGRRPSLSYSYVASGANASSLSVVGAIDTGGLATTVHVEYGPTVSYGSRTDDTKVSPFPVAKSFRPTFAEVRSTDVPSPPGMFHYRIVATNALGTAMSSDRTFTPR